uniref:NADH-ubiquinone oxidoreductase chain 6 n=1 Tax=Parocyusa longitarsis TaxID=879040 RepID=S4SUE3_9COLE|nr:NADH dehydrogenase subunit 6 [Parocyusa longitarsis]
MTMMFLLTVILSMMLILINHPLSMGLILLCQTILIALITGFLSYSFWFSYILTLIMIGGMLILFIYMTSIASNEKFSFYSNNMNIIMMISSIIFMFMLNKYLSIYNNTNLNMMNLFNENNMNFTKFINFPSNMIMFLMIIYLLITLIAVVKITNFKIGPMRQKF